MKTLLLLATLASIPVLAATSGAPGATPGASSGRSAPGNPDLDSAKLEKDLQRLPWRQFRAVVESVPKLKSAVDAYGPVGWQFVQANYRNYGWKKNIDHLDAGQKKQLADKIRAVQGLR